MMISVVLAVAALFPLPASSFTPSKLFAFVGQSLEQSREIAIGHDSMTRTAILTVAAEMLSDNAYDAQSQQRIAALGGDFDEDELVTAYFGRTNYDVSNKFIDAIEEITDANADVDITEEARASAHFDSEQFQTGQNRLVFLRRSTLTKVAREMYKEARSDTGRMLHTLQDFYSHSNWVEMGETEPYSELGREDERPLVAPADVSTCTNCTPQGMSTFSNGIISFDAEIYKCEDNIRMEILSSRLLTSGYATDQEDEQGNIIEKPNGKCSHGGYIDQTRDFPAIGGINKDSPYPGFSSHHTLYFQAAQLAEQATQGILRKIRKEVNDDQKFGALLNIFIRRAASVAYVIDITESMNEEILEIQASVPRIQPYLQQYQDNLGENAAINYILVPFNDIGMCYHLARILNIVRYNNYIHVPTASYKLAS